MLSLTHWMLHACVSTVNEDSVSVSTERGLIMAGRGQSMQVKISGECRHWTRLLPANRPGIWIYSSLG